MLPFLLRDRVAARLDLKRDASSRRLIVRSAYLEPGARKDATAAAVSSEMRELAEWLNLETVVVEQRGDLAAALSP